MNALHQTLLLFSLLFCWAQTSFAQSPKGKVVEGLQCKSEILGEVVNYSIYLPPDYDQSKRSYPVVYLLHGYTDNETAWVQFGQVNHYVDKAIEEGSIAPMIIVMPDAKVTWYVNDVAGQKRYEDFFIQEFIPYIESNNRIRGQKEFRGIAGLSMGGYGSLIYAMKHPDLFAAAAPLSAAIYTEEEVVGYDQDRWDRVEGPIYGTGLVGQARISDHWKANNPLHLAKKMEIEELKKVKYYFDCGDDDFLFRGNAAIHVLFKTLEIPHEFRIRDGVHNWTYWRTGITSALEFISQSFYR